MNFKDLAKKIADIGGIITGYGAIFTQFTPTKKDDIIVTKIGDSSAQIASIILRMQALGEKLKLTGPQKLDGALMEIRALIMQSEALVGTEVVDETLMTEGITDITNGWNKVLKAVKKN